MSIKRILLKEAVSVGHPENTESSFTSERWEIKKGVAGERLVSVTERGTGLAYEIPYENVKLFQNETVKK